MLKNIANVREVARKADNLKSILADNVAMHHPKLLKLLTGPFKNLTAQDKRTCFQFLEADRIPTAIATTN